MDSSDEPVRESGSPAYGRRRVLQLLQGVGAAGLVGAAGCAGDDEGGTDDGTPTETSSSTTSTPTPAGPASFTVVSVTPTELRVPRGAPASVSATISNTGGSSGSRNVVSKVSGQEIDTRSVSLDPGEETTVSLDLATSTLPNDWTFVVDAGDDKAEGTLTIIENPNIVVLFAEDWNWGTVRDDPAVETPALDGLAADGASFDRAFCSSPSCSPARSAILSGQHFYRTGSGSVLHGSYPEELPSYPGLLEEAGYAVGHAGKGYGPGPNEEAAGPSYGSFSDFLDQRSESEPFCFWRGPSEAHRSFGDPGVDPGDVEVPPFFPDAEPVREDIASYYADVQQIDAYVAEIREQLRDAGELESTILLVTADHGFAFPRGKSNLYDAGTQVPLVVHWPAMVDGGRDVSEFVNFPDIGPTLLEAGGADVPEEMTGESFLDLLTTGSTDTPREEVIVGYERHVPDQEESDCGEGYPKRAIRTDDYLYVHNFLPDNWPNGTPNVGESCKPDRWIASCDDGPTKFFIYANRDRDDVEANDRGDSIADLYDLAFGKRPQDELYVIEDDPHQMNNVAGDSEYEDVLADLRERLFDELEATDDPRVVADDPSFDEYPYRGPGGGTYPGDATIEQYEL